MIKLFRIDERLIHGQIAIKWSKHTGVDRIIVANDAASTNSIIQKSLMMASPSGIKVAIKNIDDSIALLKDPRCANLKMLLLVNCPADALKMLNSLPEITYMNVGNYGRVAPEKAGFPRKCYGHNMYCNSEEVDQFKQIIAKGIKCIYQTTPEESAEDLKGIFN